MARIIASLADGRVVPWFPADDPPPENCVEIPAPLRAKWRAGEITDGVALAKAALAGDAPQPAKSPAKKPARAEAAATDASAFGGATFA